MEAKTFTRFYSESIRRSRRNKIVVAAILLCLLGVAAALLNSFRFSPDGAGMRVLSLAPRRSPCRGSR